ncbi:DUF3619 family protein [Malonomonas rubra]|uniref:DUF3619 family protein n=1 Tax=Malonomonas rubra TaxID=57040 RepID=UPI0009352C53|nr:DUF3619 family protein [Malonomonas rubra]
MIEKDDKLIEKIRQELDRSLETLGTKTCVRLAQARHQAITQPRKRSLPKLYWGAVPAGVAMLLMLALNLPDLQKEASSELQLGDLSILTATEPLEFYQEEIEFYEWLSEEFAIEEGGADGGRSSVSVGDSTFGTTGRLAGAAQSRTARFSGGV